jgi:hypothetical protein
MCSGIVLLSREGAVRIPNVSLKCVVYIGNATAKGTFKAKGTGFIVSLQRVEDEPPIFYLVTADHVRRGLVDDRNFAIRINDSDGKAQIVKSPSAFKWWRHSSDTSVDAAVYPWTNRDYPFAAFPVNRFVTEAQTVFKRDSDPGIGIGDEVFITGLFWKRAGQEQITPVVRHGHIAMMATERIPTKHYGPAYMHLIEAFTTAGLSGSPVFVNETVYFEYRGSRPRAYPENQAINPVGMAIGPTHILGLVHGMMPTETMVELNDPEIDPKQKWHSGISMVVPSNQILEIINQPELIEYEPKVEQAVKDGKPIETALNEDVQTEKSKRKNQDKPIPPISRKKVFGKLTKATLRRNS